MNEELLVAAKEALPFLANWQAAEGAWLKLRNAIALSDPSVVSDDELLHFINGMFLDRDVDIRQYRVKVVRTRRQHFCIGLKHEDYHTVPARTRCVKETAIVEGKWCDSFVCERHVVEWARECGEI